jgi:ribulose-5-phosphate 4-epimerase/fuculose-1-phosphate aldolase
MNMHARNAKPSKKVPPPAALRAKNAKALKSAKATVAKTAKTAKAAKPAKTGKRPAGMSEAEWAARIDLAAVYRLVAMHGWDDVIYNHCSMRVPGEPHMMLMKPHEALWTEVTASNLRKVNINEDLDERAGVNRPGFTLHGGLMKGRADINCAVHIHTPIGFAIAGLKDGLRMVSQEAVRFYNRIGYHPYEGITEDFGERERILRDLGDNVAMIMNNHGLVTVGKSARDAFTLMKHLVEAAEIQVMIDSTGREALEIPAQICEKVVAQYVKHDSGRGSADWPAYLRKADNVDPSYRT